MSDRRKMRTSRMQQYIRELLKEEGIEGESDDNDEDLNNNDGQGNATKRANPPHHCRIWLLPM